MVRFVAKGIDSQLADVKAENDKGPPVLTTVKVQRVSDGATQFMELDPIFPLSSDSKLIVFGYTAN